MSPENFDWFLLLHHLLYGDESRHFGLYEVGGVLLNISLEKYPSCKPFTDFAEDTAQATSLYSGVGMNCNGAIELIPQAAELQPLIELKTEEPPASLGMPSDLKFIKCRLTLAGRHRAEQVAAQFSNECLDGIKETIRLSRKQ